MYALGGRGLGVDIGHFPLDFLYLDNTSYTSVFMAINQSAKPLHIVASITSNEKGRYMKASGVQGHVRNNSQDSLPEDDLAAAAGTKIARKTCVRGNGR